MPLFLPVIPLPFLPSKLSLALSGPLHPLAVLAVDQSCIAVFVLIRV
jgi:hypothetical protein